jgi:hypothetical protein
MLVPVISPGQIPAVEVRHSHYPFGDRLAAGRNQHTAAEQAQTRHDRLRRAEAHARRHHHHDVPHAGPHARHDLDARASARRRPHASCFETSAASAQRFGTIVAQAGADVHIPITNQDNSPAEMAALEKRKAGEPHPYVAPRVRVVGTALPQARDHASADDGIGPAAMTCELSRVPLRPRRPRQLLDFLRNWEGAAPHSKARRGECVYRRAEAAAVSGSERVTAQNHERWTASNPGQEPVGAPPVRFPRREATFLFLPPTRRAWRAPRPSCTRLAPWHLRPVSVSPPTIARRRTGRGAAPPQE